MLIKKNKHFIRGFAQHYRCCIHTLIHSTHTLARMCIFVRARTRVPIFVAAERFAILLAFKSSHTTNHIWRAQHLFLVFITFIFASILVICVIGNQSLLSCGHLASCEQSCFISHVKDGSFCGVRRIRDNLIFTRRSLVNWCCQRYCTCRYSKYRQQSRGDFIERVNVINHVTLFCVILKS